MQPDTAPAGGFTRLDVRVPNERDDAGTTKVDVQLPPGFIAASYEPVPGWKVEGDPLEGATSRSTPATGFEVRRRRSRASPGPATARRASSRPAQFQDFGLSLRMPEGKAGDKLTFKALQTYDDGEVVRWIGPEDADEPAPVVTLEAAAPAAATARRPPPPAAAREQRARERPRRVVAATTAATRHALDRRRSCVGALGLIAALAALAAARRGASSSRREEVAA